jgi:hypothetical protein
LTRLGRVLGVRSDPRAGLATNSNFTVAQFSRQRVGRYSLVDGVEHFVDGLRKARSRKNERGPLRRMAGIPDSAMQSNAERRRKADPTAEGNVALTTAGKIARADIAGGRVQIKAVRQQAARIELVDLDVVVQAPDARRQRGYPGFR